MNDYVRVSGYKIYIPLEFYQKMMDRLNYLSSDFIETVSDKNFTFPYMQLQLNEKESEYIVEPHYRYTFRVSESDLERSKHVHINATKSQSLNTIANSPLTTTSSGVGLMEELINSALFKFCNNKTLTELVPYVYLNDTENDYVEVSPYGRKNRTTIVDAFAEICFYYFNDTTWEEE